MNNNKNELRTLVRSVYQMQKLRIQIGNRLVGNFKAKLGAEQGVKEDDMEKKIKVLLNTLRAEYKTLSEGVKKVTEKTLFLDDGILSTYAEYCLAKQYSQILEVEETSFKHIGKVLKQFPIWNKYLSDVKGIGPALAGILISEIDIEKATYSSSLWKYAGLDVGWDNRGRSKRKEHLVEVEYIDSSGKKKTRLSTTFNNTLKPKLIQVLGSSLLKQGEKSQYSTMYYDYKNRLENEYPHKDSFVALDVVEYKKKLGEIPSKLINKQIVSDTYQRCSEHLTNNEKTPDDTEVKLLVKKILGKYEIFERIDAEGVIVGPFKSIEDLEDAVKGKGGVLRLIKEKVVFNPDVEENDSPIQIEEEFDNSPDNKGRTVYKLFNLGKSKKHRHAMAVRYIVKRFLVDFYVAYRTLEGLPVAEEYAKVKLGITHKTGTNDVI
jgi:hypothetical protein